MYYNYPGHKQNYKLQVSSFGWCNDTLGVDLVFFGLWTCGWYVQAKEVANINKSRPIFILYYADYAYTEHIYRLHLPWTPNWKGPSGCVWFQHLRICGKAIIDFVPMLPYQTQTPTLNRRCNIYFSNKHSIFLFLKCLHLKPGDADSGTKASSIFSKVIIPIQIIPLTTGWWLSCDWNFKLPQVAYSCWSP